MQIASRLGQFWCALMHDDITWPVHGRYRCRTCHREYAVPWEERSPCRRGQLIEIPVSRQPVGAGQAA